MTRKAFPVGDVIELTGSGSAGSTDGYGTSAKHNGPTCATMDSVRECSSSSWRSKTVADHTHTHIPRPQTITYFYVTDTGSNIMRRGIFEQWF